MLYQIVKRQQLQNWLDCIAKLAILEEMLNTAKHNMNQHPTPIQVKIVEQLEAMKSGNLVSVEWGLKTLSGNPYAGRIVSSDQPDML